jgi:nitrous oxidase accessory protein NosD
MIPPAGRPDLSRPARLGVALAIVSLCAGAGGPLLSERREASESRDAQRLTPLRAGMVIDKSITIKPGTYRLKASDDLGQPALIVRGSNITIDFNGATLTGSPGGADPDTMAGVGILVDGGRRVTIKNAVIRGYTVGILGRQSPDLHITHNDLSYNWKQRLYSGIEKESLVDWMSYHNNEKDEWLRYGAAMYLSQCDRAEIDHNTAVQGQNGLMATSSSGLKIWNNTFQFLSAIGVGLYRVTGSTIMHNRIDWCVRGYSHGFYNRGQDSAGLLMYEQSSGNRVAFNSITHGGDGLFLWAGQSTMDTGKGGANDNEFYRNDFSHAVANGIEATFSRNRFIENRIEDCWHGVWGGYSYESLWQENRFARNQEGIAIEHGQRNTIDRNTFDGDETAIRLWQNASQDPDWGYPKNRDTRSHGYEIFGNTFRNTKTALQIKDTADVAVAYSKFENVSSKLALEGSTPGLSLDTASTPPALSKPDTEPLPGSMDAMIKPGDRRGRDTIIVDEWGPYDWKSPKLWPVLDQPGLRGPDYARPLKLRVLGPPGVWQVMQLKGATVIPRLGKVGDVVTLTPDAGPVVDYKAVMLYRGPAIVSPRGVKTAADEPSTFSWSRFFVPIGWDIKLFEYTDATDPTKQPDAFQKLLAGHPLKAITHDRLDYVTGRSIEEGTPRDKVALVAEGTADLPPGDYTLTVISDDGARVWMDGEVVLDSWTPHESRVDRAPISGGKRRFKVEYYEIGGFAELRFDIQRR